MEKVAVIVVALTTVTLLALTPPPDTATVAPARKFVPVRVTCSDVGVMALDPRGPVFGEIAVRVGAAGAVTVKVTALLVPPPVVTVTFLPDRVALVAMVKVAVIDVALTTVTPLTVTPVPDTATVAPATKLVPVSVTGTAAPRLPDVGLIEVSVGAAGAGTTYSIAPTSNLAVLPVSGRLFPKKSVVGCG
jgi:hypothetical protein